MRRALWILVGILVVAAIGVGGFLAIDRFGDEATATETEPADEPRTVAVVRTDLIEEETLEGILRFRDPGVLFSGGSGTVTGLPEAGEILTRGDVAFELDGSPVTLLLGERPAWRVLAGEVDDGPDIRQLEQNLSMLGFDENSDLNIDDEFDEATEAAIESWQDSLGREDVAFVTPTQIVFLPTPIRVGELFTEVGTVVAPGTAMYATSATGHEVLVLLDADRQDLLEEAELVTIVLPDETETEGVVREVSRIVITDGAGPDARRVVEVFIDLTDEQAAQNLDETPVDVKVVTNRAEGVLAVPVEALLALAEGGYALEVSSGATTRLVAVEIGEFADGLVEVGGDLELGDTVVVPE